MSVGKASKLFANVYRSINGAAGSVYTTRALADQMAVRGRLACVEFEIRDDEPAVVGDVGNGIRGAD